MAAWNNGKNRGDAMPPERADALLGNIMQDLGMEHTAAGKGRRRYALVVLRCMLPRLLLVVALAALLALLVQGVRILETNVSIRDLSGEAVQSQAATVARVSFEIEAGRLVPEITAQLGDDLLEVQKAADGSYFVDCPHDGTLVITARAWNGVRDVRSVTVSGLGG